MKKKAFGIVLLVLAALVLLQGNFGSPALGGHIWPVIGIVFLCYKAIELAFKRHITLAVLLGLVAVLIANSFFGFPPVSFQSLFWASILIVLGVGSFTHSSKVWNGKKWWYDNEHTIITEKQVAFGSGTFYKQEQDLVEDQAEAVFGDVKIYYDNADILGDVAILSVDVVFGSATIYIPEHWKVDLRVESVFSSPQVEVPTAPTSKTLIIRGDVVFGKLEVVYVH